MIRIQRSRIVGAMPARHLRELMRSVSNLQHARAIMLRGKRSRPRGQLDFFDRPRTKKSRRIKTAKERCAPYPAACESPRGFPYSPGFECSPITADLIARSSDIRLFVSDECRANRLCCLDGCQKFAVFTSGVISRGLLRQAQFGRCAFGSRKVRRCCPSFVSLGLGAACRALPCRALPLRSMPGCVQRTTARLRRSTWP